MEQRDGVIDVIGGELAEVTVEFHSLEARRAMKVITGEGWNAFDLVRSGLSAQVLARAGNPEFLDLCEAVA